MKDFNNKVALITGAGSGIGRALALQLAEEGCNLALVDWNNETLEETKSLLSSKNISVSTHNFDFNTEEKTDRMAEIEQCVDDGFEKINGNFVCSFEVKQIDEKLRDRFLNQLLESHKAIIFQTKEKGTELFTLP